MNIRGGLQAICKYALNIEFLQICFSKFTFPMCEMRSVDYVRGIEMYDSATNVIHKNCWTD